MNNTFYYKTKKYIKNCPTIQEINWYDIPTTCYVSLNKKDENKQKVKLIRKLVDEMGKDRNLNRQINGLRVSMKKGILNIKFPINLNQIDYIRLYSLMVSEGSFKSEFSLNVPEKIFHQIFKKSLKKLISNKIRIKKDFNHNYERSRAPAITRYLLPFPNHLPLILFKNKEFAREYLRIVFEAEGSPIFNLSRFKKYIKMSRNNSVTNFFSTHNLIEGKRLYINRIKKNYPKEYELMIKNPHSLILGEHLLLKYWFDIDSGLKLESIRLNKLGNRAGKISSKWVLYIYSGEDIKKFRDEIGFITENKRNICNEMLEKISSRKKQYTALYLMKKIQRNNIFSAKEFTEEMKKLGYVSPRKFIWDYWKNKKIIERVERGKYRLLIN
jgi:hypothetical protein